MSQIPPLFYLVIPCYNEQEVLPITSARLRETFSNLVDRGLVSGESRVLFVDDGSSDETWRLIEETHQRDPLFSGLKLSRNVGHQNALLAGLERAAKRADLIGSMDADLQDDVNVLAEMIECAAEGNDVVYGVRSDRSTDSWAKRFTAEAFYKFQGSMGVETVFNHADFRVMTRRAVEFLCEFEERNVFLRGLVPRVGLTSCCVYYSRGERAAGSTKYSIGKMLSFALDGISSFSIRPLRLIFILGAAISMLSLIALVYLVWGRFFGEVETGWTSIVVSIWLFGGLLLLAIGIVGEYVGKTYLETKRRPRYFVEKTVETIGSDAYAARGE